MPVEQVEPINTKSNAEFENELDESMKPVELVGEFFRRNGFKVEIPKIKKRDKFQNRYKFMDKGDIILDDSIVVEVKRRFPWDGGPWPYKDVGLNEKYKIDRFVPDVFCIVSGNLRSMLMTTTKHSREFWFDKKICDSKSKNREMILVTCPISQFVMTEL